MNKIKSNILHLFCKNFGKIITLSFLLTLNFIPSSAQNNCDEVVLVSNSSDNIDLTFDSFRKYIEGVTLSGATVLKIKVTNSALNDPLNNCRWKLRLVVSNRGGATPNDEWETITQYGTAGTPPTIDILKVSVRNACNTSMNNNNTFAPFPLAIDGDNITFIENPGTTNPNGGCGENVNGPGSYITDHNAYSFFIDYRITFVPSFTFTPGIYQLRLEYHLVEDN